MFFLPRFLFSRTWRQLSLDGRGTPVKSVINALPLLLLQFPLFEVDLSAPRVKRNKAKGPLLLHSWLIDVIDPPFVFIRPDVKLEQEFS